MSATLYFLDSENEWVRPWACQCVKRPSQDPFDLVYGVMEECGCPDLDCNMGNANARAVLVALGLNYDFENMGSLLPQELYAACERFLNSEIAEFVDNGTETVVDAKPGCATMIDCGRRADYITERVIQIKKLCEVAMLAGAMKCYFA